MAETDGEPAGGTGGTSLDPADRKDRQLIMRGIRERWPITPDVRKVLIASTVKAMKDAAKEGNARDVAGCARVIVAADAVNLKEEQEDEKNARLDAGRATERVLLIDDLPK